MEHHCDVDVAEQYWIEEAIILYNLKYWLIKNIANEVNLYDWYYWTYNSTKAFSKIFPYMSEKKISRILLDLEDKWVIKSWNYNKSPYDKTKWYTIIQKCLIDCSFLSNREDINVQPIPDNNTDNNISSSKEEDNNVHCSIKNIEDKESNNSPCSIILKEERKKKEEISLNVDDMFEWFWKAYPRKVWKVLAKKSFIKVMKKDLDIYLLAYAVKKLCKHISDNNIEQKFIKHPSVYLNQEVFRDFENEFLDSIQEQNTIESPKEELKDDDIVIKKRNYDI